MSVRHIDDDMPSPDFHEHWVPRLKRAVWPSGLTSGSAVVQHPNSRPSTSHQPESTISSRAAFPRTAVEDGDRDASGVKIMTAHPAIRSQKSRVSVPSHVPLRADKKDEIAAGPVKTPPPALHQKNGYGSRGRNVRASTEESGATSYTCDSDETWSGDSDQDEPNTASVPFGLDASDSGSFTDATADSSADAGHSAIPHAPLEQGPSGAPSNRPTSLTGVKYFVFSLTPPGKSFVTQLAPDLWRCDYPHCGQAFKGYRLCARHLSGTHAQDEMEAIEKGLLEAKYAYAVQERPEVTTQSHQERLVCPFCRKRFSRSDATKRHCKTCPMNGTTPGFKKRQRRAYRRRIKNQE
ncbi:hypothetical protein JB92DRAFT_3125241 [Gautieria morchelliformis]|nr:hypothetical protein JB92DRAFT_3125241 [Gautieria morchelliformis]